jgi:hypothetical protein
MAVDPHAVSRAADELIHAYGPSALDIARNHVERASRASDMPALDQALMILSEVERRHSVGSSSR